MGLLDDILSDDAALAFTGTDVFAESVVFTPRGGVARTISAVVVRDPAERLTDGEVKRPKMKLWIRNHASLGATSINAGGDTVTLSYRRGGTAQTFAISAPEEQDAGGWWVTVW